MPLEELIEKPTVLIDTLHNLHYRSGNAQHAKGVLVGVVGTLMAIGFTYRSAIELCSKYAPKRVYIDGVPESWLADMKIDLNNQPNPTFWTRAEGRI